MTASYQQLVAAATNRQVVQMTEQGSTVMQVVGLGTKMGDLKGEKVPYVVLKDDMATVVLLHPRDAAKLFSHGISKDFVFDDMPVDVAVDPTSVVEAKVVKEKKVAEQKQPTVTLREQAADIYRQVYAAGQKRKDFIQRVMTELNMTIRGAETYHSNFHRVNHSWHIAV